MPQTMHVDVLIIGAGVAGLSAAARLLQLAKQNTLSVCILEKSEQIGEHIISGAVMDTRALDELFPDWEQRFAAPRAEKNDEHLHLLLNSQHALTLPDLVIPDVFKHNGGRLISLAALCRWLAKQVTLLGGDILTQAPARQFDFDEEGRVCGVITGDYGRDEKGRPGGNFMPGIRIHARQTLLAEGARGSLTRLATERFSLAGHCRPQHYALGLKEIWQIDAARHHPGRIEHFVGWPLSSRKVNGGLFAYHLPEQRVALGLVADLDYADPFFSPADSFQHSKHHPRLRALLEGGTRLEFGARALAKGGWYALPKMTFPGGMLIGCAAGTLNPQRMQGIHTAMKSAMLAAETLYPWLQSPAPDTQLEQTFSNVLRESWLGQELFAARNFTPAVQQHGMLMGAALWWGSQYPGLNRLIHFRQSAAADHLRTLPGDCGKPAVFKPDEILSFDKPSSLYLSHLSGRSYQPCHLQHTNLTTQQREMSVSYCPAGVFGWLDNNGERHFQINGQNCLHCKTCDIKDPQQTLRWSPPEGGSGPRYVDM